ncbi:hypothetical protein PMAG_b0526 [Pseudoalteromonas mariniglutinosa NCIMB 1770]|nr:hypothetical protein [Pseudoalteromonas mariniglutinosa NCIMB 1770]
MLCYLKLFNINGFCFIFSCFLFNKLSLFNQFCILDFCNSQLFD